MKTEISPISYLRTASRYPYDVSNRTCRETGQENDWIVIIWRKFTAISKPSLAEGRYCADIIRKGIISAWVKERFYFHFIKTLQPAFDENGEDLTFDLLAIHASLVAIPTKLAIAQVEKQDRKMWLL